MFKPGFYLKFTRAEDADNYKTGIYGMVWLIGNNIVTYTPDNVRNEGEELVATLVNGYWKYPHLTGNYRKVEIKYARNGEDWEKG